MSDETKTGLAVGVELENRHTGQRATVEDMTSPNPHAQRRVRLSVDAPGTAADVGWLEDAVLEHWRIVGGAS